MIQPLFASDVCFSLFGSFFFSFLMTFVFFLNFTRSTFSCVQAICILKNSDFLKPKWLFIVCNFKSEVKVKVAQSCLTVTPWTVVVVHGILQARMLEQVAFPFSRASSQPGDRAQVSCIAGRFFTSWATGKPNFVYILWIFFPCQQIYNIPFSNCIYFIEWVCYSLLRFFCCYVHLSNNAVISYNNNNSNEYTHILIIVLDIFYFIYFKILFICFWLCWVFVAARAFL